VPSALPPQTCLGEILEPESVVDQIFSTLGVAPCRYRNFSLHLSQFLVSGNDSVNEGIKMQAPYPWWFLPSFSGTPRFVILCFSAGGRVLYFPPPNWCTWNYRMEFGRQPTFPPNIFASRFFFSGGPPSLCVTELGCWHSGMEVVWASICVSQGGPLVGFDRSKPAGIENGHVPFGETNPPPSRSPQPHLQRRMEG